MIAVLFEPDGTEIGKFRIPEDRAESFWDADGIAFQGRPFAFKGMSKGIYTFYRVEPQFNILEEWTTNA